MASIRATILAGGLAFFGASGAEAFSVPGETMRSATGAGILPIETGRSLTSPSGDYQETRRTLVPEVPRRHVRGVAPQLDPYDYGPAYRRGARSRYSYRPYGYHGYRGLRVSPRLGPPRLGDSTGLGRRSLR